MRSVTITDVLLLAGESSNGSWSHAQLKLLNVPLPLKKHWKRDVIGKRITVRAAREFVKLHDAHLKKDPLEKRLFRTR